jgi:acyl-coenzyme A thioesterase PaaI-like protein
MMNDQSSGPRPVPRLRHFDNLGFVPDPQNEGWQYRPASSVGRFLDVYGELRCRVEPDGKVRIRAYPNRGHSNYNENLHGGFILALIDHALFVGPAALGVARALGGATIETTTHFFAPLRPDKPVDTVLEVMRETGRMIFSRGVVEQDGVAAVSFSGVIKKGPAPTDAPNTAADSGLERGT